MHEYIPKDNTNSRTIDSCSRTCKQASVCDILQSHATRRLHSQSGTHAPIQCEPDLGAVAVARFNKIYGKQEYTNGDKFHSDIIDTSKNVYGLPASLIAEIARLPVLTDSDSYKESIRKCIGDYYQDETKGGGALASDLNGTGDNFNASLGNPATANTPLCVLKEALLSVIFSAPGSPSAGTDAAEEKTCFNRPEASSSIYNEASDGPELSVMDENGNIAGEVMMFENFKEKSKEAARLIYAIMGLKKLKIQQDSTIYQTEGALAEYKEESDKIGINPYVLALNADTAVLNITHEAGHKLETEMGVEDFAHVHRFMRARAKADAAPREGEYTYNTYMPVTGPLGTVSARQNNLPWNYASKVYGVDPVTGKGKEEDNYDTEFISTGLALFSQPEEARSLIENDPQRAAFLLYLANKPVFAQIKAAYGNKTTGITPVPPTIETVIHAK